MIRHVVSWNFKDEVSEDENRRNADTIKQELENLKDLIPEIVEIKVYTQFTSTSSRKVMLSSLFQSEEDLAKYQIHPEHKRVSELVGRLVTDRVCLDFYE